MRPIFFKCIDLCDDIENFAIEFTLAFSNPWDYEIAPYDIRKTPEYAWQIHIDELQKAMQKIYESQKLKATYPNKAYNTEIYAQGYDAQYQAFNKKSANPYPIYEDYKAQQSYMQPRWSKEAQKWMDYIKDTKI